FADPGIATKEQHGTAHQPSTDDAVKLTDAASEPRRIASRAGKGLSRECTPLAGLATEHLRLCGRFLGNGVPFAARIALALPASVNRAAVLADETGLSTGHAFQESGVRHQGSGARDATFDPMPDA